MKLETTGAVFQIRGIKLNSLQSLQIHNLDSLHFAWASQHLMKKCNWSDSVGHWTFKMHANSYKKNSIHGLHKCTYDTLYKTFEAQ